MPQVKIRRALISVSDKNGLIPFAKTLKKFKVDLVSTGGTLKALQDAGIPARPIDELTGFPEMMDGRVKTLHPKVHGGLLFRRDKKSHVAAAGEHGIDPIDLVIVNLYPFEATVAKKGVTDEEAIEKIDIGGPSMLRSAAKNFDAVTVVTDPADYERVQAEMKKTKGGTTLDLRRELALKVFERTSSYDRAIAGYLKKGASSAEGLPETLDGIYEKDRDLRYGENPHQRAGLYLRSDKEARFSFDQLHGKELSYNNFLDIEAAVDIMREFDEPAACVIKHTNPCGVAAHKKILEALENAVECDSMSAFGGIVAVNQPFNQELAERLFELLPFFEVVIAPVFKPDALKVLTKRKNLRIIQTGAFGSGGPYDLKFIKQGILVQDRDRPILAELKELRKNLKVVTKTKLKPSEIDDLLFGWKCVKVVKSNAIVLTQGRQTVGIGAGQMSRVDSVEIACRKAGYRTEGAYLASDAFFPMPDSIEMAHEHKIKAIIQPGGSVRDKDVIAACDRLGIAMVCTGKRHFRH